MDIFLYDKFHKKFDWYKLNTYEKILNSIKMVKNSWIKNTIKEEGKNENDIEIIDNVWIPMKKEILEQDIINQQIMEKIYQKYLNNNLNKYNNVLEDENKDIKIVDNDSDDAWDSFSQKSDEEKNKNKKEKNKKKKKKKEKSKKKKKKKSFYI